MNIFDIITLSTALILVAVCAWKGLIKIALKFGALIVSGLIAKLIGPAIGAKFFSNLVKEKAFSLEVLSGEMLKNVNEILGIVLGTVLAFIVLYIILRIVVRYISKLIKKVTKTSLIDHLLGALFGFAAAFVLIVVFAKVVSVVATVTVLVDPSSDILNTIENTIFFKFFI